jgi:hypothetical protein
MQAIEEAVSLLEDAMLTRMAGWIKDNWFAAHRRAFRVGKLVLMFGNDGVGDPAVTAELEYVFQWLRKRGHLVVAFGACSEHFTWVLIVRPAAGSDPEEEIDKMVWDAWKHAARLVHKLRQSDPASVRKRQAEALCAAAARLPQVFKDWLKSARFREHEDRDPKLVAGAKVKKAPKARP